MRPKAGVGPAGVWDVESADFRGPMGIIESEL